MGNHLPRSEVVGHLDGATDEHKWIQSAKTQPHDALGHGPPPTSKADTTAETPFS